MVTKAGQPRHASPVSRSDAAGAFPQVGRAPGRGALVWRIVATKKNLRNPSQAPCLVVPMLYHA